MWCQLRWWPFVCLPGKEDQSIEWRDRIVFFCRKLPETGYQRQRWRRGKNKFKHFQYFAAGNCHQHRVSLLGARVADVTDRCVHLEEMEAPFAVGPFSSSVSFRTLFANPQVVFFFLFSPAADGNCLCWPLQKLRMQLINYWRHSSGFCFSVEQPIGSRVDVFFRKFVCLKYLRCLLIELNCQVNIGVRRKVENF